jgi:pimeloyl-ACP methyl ester carboxylesterase
VSPCTALTSFIQHTVFCALGAPPTEAVVNDIERMTPVIQDADVADLRRRLKDTRWPDAFDEGSWHYGVEPGWLRRLTAYWLEGYDFAAFAGRLASHDHRQLNVDGVRLHVAHAQGVGPKPLPLVLTHGWPSSFLEWSKVLGPLSDPAAHGGDPADAFTVLAPSLPGYGFSERSMIPGMSPRRIAALWADLARRFGHEEFGAVGCDWGAYVTSLLGLHHPEGVVGIQLGMLSLSPARSGKERTAEEAAYAERVRRWGLEEHGYVALQSSKPETLAYGLMDSPVGLLAWIAEKWASWTDCDGALETVVSMDELLDVVSLYWFTRTIGSASRLYRESRLDPVRLEPGERVGVPTGFVLEPSAEARERRGTAAAPRMGPPPRSRAEQVFDVHRWTELERGGHFPAMEVPDVFVDEVRAFFRPLRT